MGGGTPNSCPGHPQVLVQGMAEVLTSVGPGPEPSVWPLLCSMLQP